MTLKYQTFSAIRWTTTAAFFKVIIQIAQLSILARLLSPEDYGLMAMVSVVLGFAYVLSDLGLNSAYVQRQEVTIAQRSSLYWLNVTSSLLLTFIVLLLSPFLSKLFGDERLSPLIMLSSGVFVLNALGQQIRMSAEKSLNFRPVIIIEIFAALLGFVVAVFLALKGMAVYSLIFGSLVSALVASILLWIFVADGWRPMWNWHFEDIRPYIGFGGALVANVFVNYLNRSVDLILGGRLLGAAQLGVYSVPRNFILQIQFLVNPIITRVGFPLIAQIQDDIPRVKRVYLKTINMTASTNAPLYVGLAFFAQDIVYVLLGNNWAGSVRVLSVLAIWGYFRSVGNPVGSLLLGMGRADLALKWNIGMLFFVVPLLWVGSYYGGVMGLVWLMLGFVVFAFIPGWYLLIYPLCEARLGEYALAVFKPLAISVISIFTSYLCVVNTEGSFLRLCLAVIVSAVLYIAINKRFNSEWYDAMFLLFGRER